jgi:branched-chain amino acid transport system substrate-binding protein
MNGHAAETDMPNTVLEDALERAGTTDRNAVRDAPAEAEICGERNILPHDCIRFGESGQSPETQPVVLQIIDGAHRTVGPPEVAARHERKSVTLGRSARR